MNPVLSPSSSLKMSKWIAARCRTWISRPSGLCDSTDSLKRVGFRTREASLTNQPPFRSGGVPWNRNSKSGERACRPTKNWRLS